mgnify:CR=1 FL=1
MQRSMIIIGAGIAGLSAGCYGQMNGYDTRILEMHDKPGGLCTSWERKGYTFDGCLHWLVGSGEGSSFNRIWQELGALQDCDIVDHQVFLRVEGQGGKAFNLYTNVDRLEEHMLELAPVDADVTREFCGAIRRFSRIDEVMPLGPSSILDQIRMGVKMLPHLGAMRRYARTSTHEFAERFSDPFLRWAFAASFDLPRFPMLGMLMTLAWMHNHDAGYPIGGSLAFARAIERHYEDLGGQIDYGSVVEKILVEDDRAVGVRLADGTEHRADVVISAADGHATIFDMLEGRYTDDEIRNRYEKWPIFQPIIQVSLGVARDLSAEPHTVLYPLEVPVMIAGEMRERIGVKHYCYDPTLAPPGKSVVTAIYESNHDYWEDLYDEPERYDAEKKEIALRVMDAADQRFPGIANEVEAVDVTTPMTYERYTGNWQGSMEGWLVTTDRPEAMMGSGMDQTLPGLERFYMAGQWVQPGGGVPAVAWSARKAVQMICKEDGRPFVTTVATAGLSTS